MAEDQPDLNIQVETGSTLVNLNQRYRAENEDLGITFYFYEFNVADAADVSDVEIVFSCD